MSFEYYNRNGDNFFKDTVNLSMNHIYEKFLPYVKKSGLILDVGCGSGRDSKYFIDRGYSVIAVDASEKMVDLARSYSSADIRLMNFNEINWLDKFDGIWACASLLHISSNAFLKVGKKLYSALKNNGVIYMSFKAGEGNYKKDGRFFQCYNKNKIQKLIKEVGFSNEGNIWITKDVRSGREEEKWLNIIYIKKL